MNHFWDFVQMGAVFAIGFNLMSFAMRAAYKEAIKLIRRSRRQ